jgi:hypothetical protein
MRLGCMGMSQSYFPMPDRDEMISLIRQASKTTDVTPERKAIFMADEPTNTSKSFGDIAPHLAEITDKAALWRPVGELRLVSARSKPGDDHVSHFAL